MSARLSDVQFFVVLGSRCPNCCRCHPHHTSLYHIYIVICVRKADRTTTLPGFLSPFLFPYMPPCFLLQPHSFCLSMCLLCGNNVVYWPGQSIISVYSENWQLKGGHSAFILPFLNIPCFRVTRQP